MGVKELGEKIRVARLSRSLTQAQLAESIGVKSSTVGMWENGKREPNLDMMEALADVFNVPVAYLVEAKESKIEGGMTPRDKERLEALHENPRLGLLFDRAKNLPPEDIDFMEQLMDRILKERDGN